MIDLANPKAASFMRSMAKQTPMRRNGNGGRDRRGGAVLRNRAAVYYRPNLVVDGGLGL